MAQTDENVSALVKKIVAEIEGSMLHMHLKKAAWVSVNRILVIFYVQNGMYNRQIVCILWYAT